MTIVLDRKDVEDADKLKQLIDVKLKKKEKQGNLAKHFGELKRGLDGLDYQMAMRKDED